MMRAVITVLLFLGEEKDDRGKCKYKALVRLSPEPSSR